MTESNQRKPDAPIDPIFLERWSPRAYDGVPFDDATIASLFEAARWSPSAYNGQPWRFSMRDATGRNGPPFSLG